MAMNVRPRLRPHYKLLVAGIALTIGIVGSGLAGRSQDDGPQDDGAQDDGATSQKTAAENKQPAADDRSAKIASDIPKPQPIQPFVSKGLDWLVAAQHENGGWGAGSHANQNIRDPHKVKTDPATTAFVASALLRAGHTPVNGKYKKASRRATKYLCKVVETAPTDGPKITDVAGTQPQSKLGALVDTTMTAQYMARLLPLIPKDDPLYKRVDNAVEITVTKLQTSQLKNGSWHGGGGWAPVLQSALGCSSLELAQAAGKRVDNEAIRRARSFQKSNFDRNTGNVNASGGAGVKLYAFSGAQRANAGEARAAKDLIEEAKGDGKLEADAPVNAANLKKIGVNKAQAERLANANDDLQAQNKQLNNEQLLAGFGNNGGEEYLSYLMTSESLVIQGGNQWKKWNDKMHQRLKKIQSNDGSWTGHHCITSPVFCTAAVVQCLTVDRDAKHLIEIAKRAAKSDPNVKTVSKNDE